MCIVPPYCYQAAGPDLSCTALPTFCHLPGLEQLHDSELTRCWVFPASLHLFVHIVGVPTSTTGMEILLWKIQTEPLVSMFFSTLQRVISRQMHTHDAIKKMHGAHMS